MCYLADVLDSRLFTDNSPVAMSRRRNTQLISRVLYGFAFSDFGRSAHFYIAHIATIRTPLDKKKIHSSRHISSSCRSPIWVAPASPSVFLLQIGNRFSFNDITARLGVQSSPLELSRASIRLAFSTFPIKTKDLDDGADLEPEQTHISGARSRRKGGYRSATVDNSGAFR